jgi:heptosyltransferase-2
LLRILGDTIQSKDPEVFPDKYDRKIVDDILSQLKPERHMVALAPGSVWATKRWLAERFASLASRITQELDAEAILVGGPQDTALCDRIASRTKGRALNCAGHLTLRQSAELISRCDVLVTNDSAPMHLAVAVGTPVLAVFGPTVPEFGFRPFGEGHVVVQKDLTCRPCRIHGGPKCPIGTHECMRAIQLEEVYEQVESMMSK